MTMAVTRRTSRRSESGLNSTDGSGASEPMLPISVRQDTGINVDDSTPSSKVGTSWFSRRQRLRTMSNSVSPPSPNLFLTLWQQLFVPREIRINQIKQYLRSKNPKHVAAVALFLSIGLYCYLYFLMIVFFGPRGSVKGGHFGALMDQYAKDYVRYHTMSKWRQEIRDKLHIPLVHSEQDGTLLEPRFWPLDVIIKTRPNAAVVEMLLREKARVQKLDDMIQSAAKVNLVCSKDPTSAVEIPRTVLLLENYPGQRNQLLPYWITRSESLEIDSFSVYKKDIYTLPASIDLQKCQQIISGIDNYAVSTNIELHCLAFSLGGMQLSSSVSKQHRPLIDSVLNMLKAKSSASTQKNSINNQGSCNTKIGYAVLSNTPTPELELRRTSSIMSYVSTIYTALPPNHPASLCLPPYHGHMGISPYTEANLELSFQSIFANRLITTISHARSNSSMNSTETLWGVATFHCDFEKKGLASCCNDAAVSIVESPGADMSEILEKAVQESPSQHLIFTVRDAGAPLTTHEHLSAAQFSLSVKEKQSARSKAISHPKVSIRENLKSCEPGWWCNRCLQTSLYGSFSKCKSICKKCVADTICTKVNTKPNEQVTININAKGSSFPSLNQHKMQLAQQRIPRIIHQTWFEDITIESYPQLFRLQNTWRASGWDYRFYTDDSARKYIEVNYPTRFVTVFDSLVPGAYKADFFRYLVLYKEGGIYVDVDVMLNANLDSFITPDLAFFAPIDAVGSYADEHFCVWNGLLGSAPAHPILTNVIEWMVNLVSSRGDMYDMERMVCNFSGGKNKIENWKVRAEPSLMLSGPCALGLAMNNALGNEPLAKFDAGLIKRNGFNQRNVKPVSKDLIGDVMILVADKQDLGAFRFSDPERNIVVATTDMTSLSKSPMTYETKALNGRGMVRSAKKVKPHYSISTQGQQLWGTHDVYSDDLAIDEHVSLIFTFEE